MFSLFSTALSEAVDAAEAAPATPSWFETATKGLLKTPVWGWIVLGVLLVGGLVFYFTTRGKQKTVWTTKMLALGAICMALSSVLSMIKVMEMPQGGSVTAASMLPLMTFAYVYGVGPGVFLGMIHGLLQFILKPYFLSLPQMLLDYPIAFGMIGLAGLFAKKEMPLLLSLSAGIVLASIGRLVAAVLSGVLFFAEYAEGTGLSPLMYSISYNASYMVPETLITVLLGILIGHTLVKELRKQGSR